MKVEVTCDAEIPLATMARLVLRMGEDLPIMQTISELLMRILRENIDSGNYVPDLPATVERKRRMGKSLRVLNESGALRSNLRRTAKRHKARATRGVVEEYGVYHALGLGRQERRNWASFGDRREEIRAIYNKWVLEEVHGGL